jgi:archaellum component FlaC
MAKGELKNRINNILEKLVYFALIGLAVFVFKINAKVNTIDGNAKKIEALEQRHTQDKNILHQKISKETDKITELQQAVSSCKTAITFLTKEHP